MKENKTEETDGIKESIVALNDRNNPKMKLVSK